MSSSSACSLSGGSFQGNFTECSMHCGACCQANSSCTQMVEPLCTEAGGVHQGNGTARIFQGEPRVFTFSIHQENNYPLKEESDLDRRNAVLPERHIPPRLGR